MWLAVVALLASTAVADDVRPTRTLTVSVGGSEVVQLAAPISMGKCDDESIVRIDTSNQVVRLIGLKAGKTLCGFWTNPKLGTHEIIEVTVIGGK